MSINKKSWTKQPKDKKRKIAVLCSDLHLSHRCPPFRSQENWYEVMAKYLGQLKELAINKIDWGGNLPIICAGDIFDRWNEPAELINMCLQNMPNMYAIPGQHDLPYHSYEDIHKSAYWTLVKGGTITNLDPHQPPIEIMSQGTPICLHPFPYEFNLRPPKSDSPLGINLAVVHSYLWIKDHSYPDAPAAKRLKSVAKILRHYDAAVFGDNHKGFLSTITNDQGTDISVLNAGAFLRRKSDEVDYKPAVGLLYDDGSIERKFLDTSKDVLGVGNNKEKSLTNVKNYRQVLDELNRLGDAALNFVAALHQAMEREGTGVDVRREIETAIEESSN